MAQERYKALRIYSTLNLNFLSCFLAEFLAIARWYKGCSKIAMHSICKIRASNCPKLLWHYALVNDTTHPPNETRSKVSSTPSG
jgi:hypothetical protein